MEQLQTTQSNNQVIPMQIQVYKQQSVSESNKIQHQHIIHISHSSLQNAPGTITYQQTTSHHHAPVTQMQELQTHMPTLQSCNQQISLQSQPVQTQVIQPHAELQSQPMQQLILPVFKHHMTVNSMPQSTHYYTQYDYQKEKPNRLVPKLEPELQLSIVNKAESNLEISIANCENIEGTNPITNKTNKRHRCSIPDPTKWACNVRKLKHQRGEAYINRRGKYVPERQVKNTKDCLRSCKYKCNEHINNADREQIFKAFYSLSANEKKHFLLNTTERHYTKRPIRFSNNIEPKRKYSFKYSFTIRGAKYTVCKNFYLGTLAISQKPVYNVHSSKSDMNLPKPDGRGLSETSTQGIASELKDEVRKHIMSFQTMESKPVMSFSKKKQFLDPSLSVKQMYKMYLNRCREDNIVSVKESMYRKIFKKEFNLDFKRIKMEQLLCSRCKVPVKKK